MKKVNLLLFFVFTAQLTLRSQQASSPEKSQVEATIQLYFDGWATGDTTKLGKAMHTTCHLKYFRDGQFTDISRLDYLARFKPRERDAGLVTRIALLDITDNIAGAKAEIDTGKDIFTDYFNLIKTNEGWFIVDKISTRKSKLQKK